MILVTFAELGYGIFTLEHTDTQFLILTIFHSSYLTSAPNFLYERNKIQNNGGSTRIKDRFSWTFYLQNRDLKLPKLICNFLPYSPMSGTKINGLLACWMNLTIFSYFDHHKKTIWHNKQLVHFQEWLGYEIGEEFILNLKCVALDIVKLHSLRVLCTSLLAHEYWESARWI